MNKNTRIQYNLELVKEIFTKNNCILLSTEYKRCANTLQFICKCKKENKLTFTRFLIQKCCNDCHSKTITNRRKYTYTEVKQIFIDNNCELLNENYTKNTLPLNFKCKCNYDETMTFKKYLVQKCCESCHSKTLNTIFKYTYNEVKELFEANNCTLLSTEYKNNNSKLDIICECGNKVQAILKSFLKGHRCKFCKITQTQNTNLNKYGNVMAMNSKQLKEKWIHKIQNRTDKEKLIINIKRIDTNLEKYGVEFTLQLDEIKEKGKITCLKKYGVEYSLQSKEIRDKGKLTCLDKYGVEYPTQSSIIQNKTKQTCLQKYGVEYIAQDPIISEKMFKNFKFKKYTFPCGKNVNIQGYENFALDILLKEYKEEDILTNRSDMPKISYWYNKKNRIYFPDIYIPNHNKIIEVKSIYTYKKFLIQNILKALQVRKMGYDFEIWIINKKGFIDYII